MLATQMKEKSRVSKYLIIFLESGPNVVRACYDLPSTNAKHQRLPFERRLIDSSQVLHKVLFCYYCCWLSNISRNLYPCLPVMPPNPDECVVLEKIR